ncbi:hypothetical protein BLL52_1995 [Rhodoferax antarcticus ANT.BR]|uniref:Uncharacterized protein n=2 Tax=Rhodoferax antarcticus TaxID=81479 RepID=A0A1Q8YCZ2_9BURK|nr:hypothetical protein BLL52_1995 [Rhodoferax antarcticus ANT.BR]
MYTMNRWLRAFKAPLLILALCLTFVACLLPSVAEAQGMTRPFPAKALRGIFQVTTPPTILLDGAPARLSPGARIRGTNNLIVMSGTLVGQQLRVNYVRDGQGLIHEVWILTDAEAQQKRPGNDTISNIRFESDARPASN